MTLGRSSFFLCFPSSPLFVSAFFPLLLFFFICLSPLCYCFESGKTSSLCFSSWSSFLQSSTLSVLVMYSADFSFRNWVSFFALFVACVLLVLDSVFLGSVLALLVLSLPLYFLCDLPVLSPVLLFRFLLCPCIFDFFLLCSMPSFSISGSSSLTPLLLACSSQSPLVLFPPLIFGPSSSVAEAFSGFCLSLYSRFFLSIFSVFFFCFWVNFSVPSPPKSSLLFPGLSLAFIKPEKVWCPCLHKWWASWKREIMTASWV